MRKLKSLIVHLAIAVTLSITGVALATSDDSTPVAVPQSGANTQQGGPVTQPSDVINYGPPAPANEPAEEPPTEVAPDEPSETPTDEPVSTTPDEPTSEPEPEPQPPAPTLVSKGIHFIDVSSVDEPNSKAQQWCDYTYSDGSTISYKISTLYKQGGFSQPISNYSESNPPGVVSGC